jgi:hypothetical protein
MAKNGDDDIRQAKTMDGNPESMHQLGAFEPREAKKLLPLLEAKGIRFEVEMDHSALARPNRALQLYFGMYPEGSKLVIFVPESEVGKAMATIKELFPI